MSKSEHVHAHWQLGWCPCPTRLSILAQIKKKSHGSRGLIKQMWAGHLAATAYGVGSKRVKLGARKVPCNLSAMQSFRELKGLVLWGEEVKRRLIKKSQEPYPVVSFPMLLTKINGAFWVYMRTELNLLQKHSTGLWLIHATKTPAAGHVWNPFTFL